MVLIGMTFGPREIMVGGFAGFQRLFTSGCAPRESHGRFCAFRCQPAFSGKWTAVTLRDW